MTRPASSAAAAAGSVVDNIKGTPGELSLAPGAGWDDWQVIRDQHADHSTIRVFVRKGETAASAKVRLVLAQRPKPPVDSPQAIYDTMVQTARQLCQKVSADLLHKSEGDLTFELRGFECRGQQGERYLLQRISFFGQWELEVTYAPISATNDLPPPEKQQALKLLSSVTITGGASSEAPAGWFLITPPQQSDGHYDTAAPLSKWKVEEGAGSRVKCEGLQTYLSSLALEQGRPGDIEEVKDSRCVSQDDPRLTGN
jgi:hypothetical protein